MVTEEDRQLLTQRAVLQTAAVIEHISHEQAEIWLVSLLLLCFFSISSFSCYSLPPQSPTMSYSLSHTAIIGFFFFFTLSRNPGEPWSWPTCNYSIFRISSKSHSEPRDMAWPGFLRMAWETWSKVEKLGGVRHWLHLVKPCNTILNFPAAI